MDVLSMALSAEGNMVINRRLAELFDCKDTAFVLQYLIARQNKAGHGFTCNAKELEHGCIIGEHKRRSIFKRLKKGYYHNQILITINYLPVFLYSSEISLNVFNVFSIISESSI